MKKYFSAVLIIFIILTVTACSADKPEVGSDAAGVDVDFTVLSGIVAYAKFNEVMSNPDDYIGKTIKLNGPYAVSPFQGGYYHFVLVEGADACCPEGIEFRLSGSHVYPDDYPPERTKIEFTGIFGSHEDFGYTYYYIMADDITILE